MAARQVVINLFNGLATPLVGEGGGVEGGIWTTAAPGVFAPGSWASFAAESDGLWTGTEGEAVYRASGTTISGFGQSLDAVIHLRWNNPWIWGPSTRPIAPRIEGAPDPNVPTVGSGISLSFRLGSAYDNAVDTWPDGWAQVGLPIPIPDGHIAHLVAWVVVSPATSSTGNPAVLPPAPPLPIGQEPVRGAPAEAWIGNWADVPRRERCTVIASIRAVIPAPEVGTTDGLRAYLGGGGAVPPNGPESAAQPTPAAVALIEGDLGIPIVCDGQITSETVPKLADVVPETSGARARVAPAALQVTPALEERVAMHAWIGGGVSPGAPAGGDLAAPSRIAGMVDWVDAIAIDTSRTLYLYQEILANGSRGRFQLRYRHALPSGELLRDVVLVPMEPDAPR